MIHLDDVYIDTPIAARLPDAILSSKLAEISEEPAEQFTSKGIISELFSKTPPLWKSASHAFGFIQEISSDLAEVEIVDVGSIAPRPELANKRINVTLNYLRIAQYPGTGDHRILFDFYAKNQMTNGSEEVHFAATYRIREGERAGIKGFPIFVGLGVGLQGVALRCFTVNVKNDDDEKLLSVLDSDIFKSGLKLASTAQPAVALLSGMAVGLTKVVAGRNRNVPVQDIYLGLDFTRIPGGARLSTGAYLAVQVPEVDKLSWNWDKWVFKPKLGQVVKKESPDDLIPFNYFMFGVSEFRDE